MVTSSITKINIVGIEEVDFKCAFCGVQSTTQYNVNVNEEPENNYQVCLLCHNQIAKRISANYKKRRRNY